MACSGLSVEKMLGALPVVADYCHRLDLAGIIDRACLIREDVAILTHGQVIEALVAIRLTSPTPLLRVSDWARSWAVPEVLGIDPATLNDDRIARALDAIAPELDRIVRSVGAQAMGRCRRSARSGPGSSFRTAARTRPGSRDVPAGSSPRRC